MAKERILVLEANTNDFIYKHFNGNFFIPRQEAIERMVLAMHNEEIKRSIKDIPCDYRNLAEAALNSLLEGK